jgi:hypothetical protein
MAATPLAPIASMTSAVTRSMAMVWAVRTKVEGASVVTSEG